MSTDPIRAALELLMELDDTVPHNRPGWIQEWTDATARARAALSEPADGPAVHGRGPAAVTSEASPPDA